MGELFVYVMKSAICLASFYLFYKVLLTRDTLHRMNRCILLLCMVLSSLIPFIRFTVEKPTVVNQPILELEDMILMSSVSEPEIYVSETPVNWMALVMGIYLLGMLLLLGYYVCSACRLLSMIRHCSLQKKEGHSLIVHELELAPFSWLHYIFISKKDLTENGDIFLTHEKAHIDCRHSYDLLLATFCTILQWFNPAAWLLKQELENIHEYEADDQVLNRGIDAKTYQLLLIKKAAGARLYSLANSFNHSSLKKRITMMLKKKSSVWAYAKYAFVLPVTAVAVAAFARPEVINLSEEMEAVTVEDLSTSVSKITYIVDKDSTVYSKVDVAPAFPGGEREYMKFMAMHLRYPSSAQEEGEEGFVHFNLVIDSNGTATVRPINIRSERLLKEVRRVVADMPKWTPGKLKGKAVNTQIKQKIWFLLEGSSYDPEIGPQDIIFKGYGGNGPTVSSYRKPEAAENDDAVFQVVENQPQFPGGFTELMGFLAKNMKYPEEASKAGIEGRVVVQFVIAKDGNIKDAKVVRSIHPLLDDEALRVVALMPKWEPGKHKGEAVNVRYTLPVSFRADKKDSDNATGNPTFKLSVESSKDGNATIDCTVLDADTHEPLVGAGAVVLGTTNGIITNTSGFFHLDAKEGQQIQITYPDYTKNTFPVAGNTKGTILLHKEKK
ncbi:MAG: TonB family protein [Bacteroidaceae bacterium]|nr:TonB family protein [Bacteroidaceae bacterium]